MNYSLEIVGASVFTVFCVILARIYSLLNRAYFYWHKRNVNGPKPSYIIGTWKGFDQKFLGSEDYANFVKYGNVYGTYDGLTPNLLVADPDVLKEVLVSSAENFQDVRAASEKSVILRDSLLFLCGETDSKTQVLRSSLLGSYKLGKVIPKLEESVENLIGNIVKNRSEDGLLNITPSVTEFITDAIALSIFGIELNADVEFKDEFVKRTEQLFNVKAPQSMLTLLPVFYKNFSKDSWICPTETLQYFVKLILSEMSKTSTESSSDGKTSSNLIEVIVQAAEEEKKLVNQEKEEGKEDVVLTDNIIISTCIASILTLVNATKTTLVMGLHALADNEEIQENLFKEIEKAKSEKVGYEDIQNLSYLDKVVKEILRLFPFEFRLEKVCTENVKIGEVEIDKDVKVSTPLYALHRSEDFYPEPDKFDPERFSAAALEKRSSFAYLPFGKASLNGLDISLQLGIVAAKIALIKLVENLKFSEVRQSGLKSLFQKGFTGVPKLGDVELLAQTRVRETNLIDISKF